MKILTQNWPRSLGRERGPLTECLKAFARTLPVERVILFGSHARNQAGRKDSDVDLCIVVRGIRSQYQAACQLRRAVGRIRDKPAFSLIPISPERLLQKQIAHDPFFETVLREGVRLAEKD